MWLDVRVALVDGHKTSVTHKDSDRVEAEYHKAVAAADPSVRSDS